MVSVSESGALWLASLASDEGTARAQLASGDVPVAIQALLSRLAGSDDSSSRLTALDHDERPVEVTAERAVRLDPQRGEEVTGGYSVLVRRASGAESSLTGAQWPWPRRSRAA